MINQERDRSQRCIYLAGDDGQMLKLLGRMPEYEYSRIKSEIDILSAISESVELQPDVIMLNLCNSGTNSCAITEALRAASKRSKIIGFGEAWTEVYYSQLKNIGMHDMLVMPAPLHEVRNIVFNYDQSRYLKRYPAYCKPGKLISSEDVSAMANVFSSMVSGSFMEICQELSMSVPYGAEVLSRKAESIFSKFLQVKQIRIYSDLRDCASDTSDFGIVDHFDVPLVSVTEENFGIMRIWPGKQIIDMELVNSIAGYLAVLLSLAWRDQNLRSLATTDELTGAHNRRYLESFLRQLLEKSEDQEIKIAVLVFDIDNFKYFNDTYGHIAGDNILCQAIELVKQCCRKHDVVARLGGDEFAVLFWDSPEVHRELSDGELSDEPMPGHTEMVMRISDTFRKQISSCTCASRYGGGVSKLTISGGVATYPTDGQTVKQLLCAADIALLRAKTDGKDKINVTDGGERR